jgi:hypothetical protein
LLTGPRAVHGREGFDTVCIGGKKLYVVPRWTGIPWCPIPHAPFARDEWLGLAESSEAPWEPQCVDPSSFRSSASVAALDRVALRQ